jgi:hypothetical protein
LSTDEISSRHLFYLFVHFLSICKVISIECFEKIRHAQKIFPLKSLKGYKCIYNELERKGSLPYIEQKRATSSSPRPNNSNSPTNLSHSIDQQTSINRRFKKPCTRFEMFKTK